MIKISKNSDNGPYKSLLAMSNNDVDLREYPGRTQKIQSPRFGETKSKPAAKDSSSVSLNLNNRSKISNQQVNKKQQMIYLKLENHINSFVFILFTKIQIMHLSQGFTNIMNRAEQRKGKRFSLLVKMKLKANLESVKRILKKKLKANLTEGFLKIARRADFKFKEEQLKNSYRRMVPSEPKSAYTNNNDFDRKLELIEFEKKNSKLSKKSNLDSQYSKKFYYDVKQNENIDNVTTIVEETQNKTLKKEISKTEREQIKFVEQMNELLDQYQITATSDDTNTTRPVYLTSFCSSPTDNVHNLHNRIKTINLQKNKYRDKRY